MSSKPSHNQQIEQQTTENLSLPTLLDGFGTVSRFLHDTPRKTVQTPLEDTADVRDCLADAVEYFHSNLTPEIRTLIQQKWGISDKAIDSLKIGYTQPGKADPTLVEYLTIQGHDRFTIFRTGLVSSRAFNAIYSANPIDNPNSSITETLPPELTALSVLQSQSTNPDYGTPSLLEPAQIDFVEVFNALEANDDVDNHLRMWWDHRIVFPYRDKENNFSYLIGRQTPDTSDIIYKNGIAEQHYTDSVTIRLTTDETGTPIFDPPAVSISPGTTVIFETDIQTPIYFETEFSRDHSWGDGPFDQIGPVTCSDGGAYLFQATINPNHPERYTAKGSILATNTFNSDKSYGPIENWLSDQSNYELDIPKYVKLTVNRPWINPEAINEPIFGLETVASEHSLLLTEGITDAIVAHQNGIPAVSPATTQFKYKHFPQLLAVAEQAKEAYIVMDNDENESGTDGALRTARMLEKEGVKVTVGELPRPDGYQSFDVAEFFKHYDRDQFIRVLQDSVKPENHPQYDPEKHDTSWNPNSTNNSNSEHAQPVTGRSSTSTSLTEEQLENASGMYKLTIPDIATNFSLNYGASGTLGRGSNPFLDTGHSNSFVVINEQLAYEHWAGVKSAYTPLSWLACKIGLRPADRPEGEFTDNEIWELWKHCKTELNVEHPDEAMDWETDPVPVRAVWHIARKHSLCPPTEIPDSHRDGTLPTDIFNQALAIIKSEYGIHPGRDIDV